MKTTATQKEATQEIYCSQILLFNQGKRFGFDCVVFKKLGDYIAYLQLLEAINPKALSSFGISDCNQGTVGQDLYSLVLSNLPLRSDTRYCVSEFMFSPGLDLKGRTN